MRLADRGEFPYHREARVTSNRDRVLSPATIAVMPRSTKIVATLGPACSKPDVLRRTAPKYPRAPIVDLAASREMALAAYQELRRTG